MATMNPEWRPAGRLRRLCASSRAAIGSVGTVRAGGKAHDHTTRHPEECVLMRGLRSDIARTASGTDLTLDTRPFLSVIGLDQRCASFDTAASRPAQGEDFS